MSSPPDRPGPAWRTLLALLKRLPTGALSRLAGRLADLPLPRWARRPVLGAFVAVTGIDMSEAEWPLGAYGSVNELFVRRLKPGLRAWPDDPHALASPVDGIVGRSGRIADGHLVQAKGRYYTVGDLLAGAEVPGELEGGVFVTLYLSPRHYHRIHAPAGGRVVEARHVPGRLLPVNQAAVHGVDDLFPTNERLLARLDTAIGPLVLVAVGAYNVGRISAAFDPEWSGRHGDWITNRGTPPPPHRTYRPGVPVRTGDPFMAFHLGSTVVLLASRGVRLEPWVAPGREVKAGTILARAGDSGHVTPSP